MGQINNKLRRAPGAYMHWCPGCRELHPLPDGWTFNGNLDSPSFQPSFKHSGYSSHHEPRICHYILTNGILNFCGDCTHALAGHAIPLPDLPEGIRDEDL